MTLPAVDINWGSDTNFSAGPESGTAVKVDPGAPALAQGFVPDNSFVGPYANYALYWITQYCKWVRGMHLDAEWLGRAFAWTGAQVWSALGRFTAGLRASAIQLVTGGDMLYTDSAGTAAPRLRTRSIPWILVDYNGTPGGFSIAGAGNLYSNVIGGGQYAASIQLDPKTIPDGSTVQLVRSWGNDGGGSLTITFGYYPVNHATGAIGAFVQLATGNSTGANVLNNQLNASSLAHVMDYSSRRYGFYIVGDNVGGAKTINDIYCTFDDPGFVGN